MSLLIKKPGIFSTVQDGGRFGSRRFGINPNGPMDVAAARVAAVLAGLDDGAAVLEMHFPAAEIVFEEETVFVIAGADFDARLDGKVIDDWRPHSATAGATLRFKSKNRGNRVYLAVSKGLGVDDWLGSASTNVRAGAGGVEGRQLRAGDRIPFAGLTNSPKGLNFSAAPSLRPRYSAFPTVRIVGGAEFDLLTPKSRELFMSATFFVDKDSDRMGFRLDGATLELSQPREMISSGVGFGTIQILPGGQPIVLMADHQTVGGYPRLAHIIPTDLPLVAQLGTNDGLGFHLVTTDVAERALIDWESDFRLLKAAMRFRVN